MYEAPEWNTAAVFFDTPIYDSPRDSIYAQDFGSPSKNIYRFDMANKKQYIATVNGGRPTGVLPVKGCHDKFLIGFEPNMTLCQWDGVSPNVTVLRDVFTGFGHIDKAAVDKMGRLFVGTSNINIFCNARAEYPLYRYDKGTVTLLVQNLKTTVGITIDEIRNFLYVVDLCHYAVVRFDLDLITGDICEIFFVSITF